MTKKVQTNLDSVSFELLSDELGLLHAIKDNVSIPEALEIDVVKLFMPIGESFKQNKENAAQLKAAIADDVRNYVNEMLREFE